MTLKKVTWATGPDFCQVKHYRKEDCPSKVGSGFSCLKKSEGRLSFKSSAIWKCPPKFHLNEKWLVVAGEESKEASKQEYRKRRVIEAVLPNKFAIPPNPCNLSDLEQGYDDSKTPVIRTIPIEEESTDDLTASVATAVAALAKSQEHGSLIDANLLVRLLLNPEEIPKLMNECGMATNVATAISLNADMVNECQAPHAGCGQCFGPKPMANIRESKSIAYSTSELDLENIKKLISKYGVPHNAEGKPLVISDLVSRYGPTSLQPELSLSPNVGHTSSMTSHKDINNYCSSFIKQRGEKTESVVDESLQNTNPHGITQGAGLLKNQKPIPCSLTPCVFFNKPKGCRNGSSCHFLHDISGKKRSGRISECRDSKRLK